MVLTIFPFVRPANDGIGNYFTIIHTRYSVLKISAFQLLPPCSTTPSSLRRVFSLSEVALILTLPRNALEQKKPSLLP